jgi:hypothetical protein
VNFVCSTPAKTRFKIEDDTAWGAMKQIETLMDGHQREGFNGEWRTMTDRLTETNYLMYAIVNGHDHVREYATLRFVSRHGLSEYNNHRCRCPICTAAKTEYQAEYRAAGRDNRGKS